MSYGSPRNPTDAEYKNPWKNAGPIEIKMVEKNEKCHHQVGDVFYYENPYERPEGVNCHALLHVFELYTWRVALGFPSWEDDDRSVYRIHCPAKKGTVWEMRKLDSGNQQSGCWLPCSGVVGRGNPPGELWPIGGKTARREQP